MLCLALHDFAGSGEQWYSHPTLTAMNSAKRPLGSLIVGQGQLMGLGVQRVLELDLR